MPNSWTRQVPDAHALDQWFSTFGSWRPTKQKKTQFGDPFSTKITTKIKVLATQKWVATRLLRNTALDDDLRHPKKENFFLKLVKSTFGGTTPSTSSQHPGWESLL